MAFRDIDDIRNANRRAGYHWFDASTLRYFSSRVGGRIYGTADGGALFVSSEQPPRGARRYSVRVARPDGSVGTVGEFMAYSSREVAHANAARLAREYVADEVAA